MAKLGPPPSRCIFLYSGTFSYDYLFTTDINEDQLQCALMEWRKGGPALTLVVFSEEKFGRTYEAFYQSLKIIADNENFKIPLRKRLESWASSSSYIRCSEYIKAQQLTITFTGLLQHSMTTLQSPPLPSILCSADKSSHRFVFFCHSCWLFTGFSCSSLVR